MIFNDHSKLAGKHALLSPSSWSWLNYEGEQGVDSLYNRYLSSYASVVGTTLHEYAEKRIRYKLKISKNEKKDILFYCLDHGVPRNVVDLDYVFENLMTYVNDAIGYRMDPEVILYYSENCFGTADSINFSNGFLRIHDLKTGKLQTHMEQLLIYAALFCLEYKIKPGEIHTETRIYQSDQIFVAEPTAEDILPIMDKIVRTDRLVSQFREGGL